MTPNELLLVHMKFDCRFILKKKIVKIYNWSIKEICVIILIN
jgi:hypothetical protein